MALKKVEKRVSLNVKIPEELDKRLKRARELARRQNKQFNVSNLVKIFLEKELKRVEKELEIKVDINQRNLDFEEWKKNTIE